MKLCPACRNTYPDDYQVCPRDQSALDILGMQIVPGTILLGKYEVISELGAGGMAVVYKARHKAFQDFAAVKVVHAHFMHDPGFIKRFRNEAVVARQLRHPNAVRIDDFDYTEDGRPFIVMEFVDGHSLYELRRDRPAAWPVDRCLNIVAQAAEALGAAHALGIVHRDIKPSNILLLRGSNGEAHVKVLDFGIAKVSHGSFAGMTSVLTQQSLIIGTPEYMSPEQASGRSENAIDGRADLYSLGLVLYEMLTGAHPFQADTPMGMLIQQIGTRPAPPDSISDVSPAVSALVLKSLQKDPADRFQSAAELFAALRDPQAWFVNQSITQPSDSSDEFSAALPTLTSAPSLVPHLQPSPATSSERFDHILSRGGPVIATPIGSASNDTSISAFSRRNYIALAVIATVVLLIVGLRASHLRSVRSVPAPGHIKLDPIGTPASPPEKSPQPFQNAPSPALVGPASESNTQDAANNPKLGQSSSQPPEGTPASTKSAQDAAAMEAHYQQLFTNKQYAEAFQAATNACNNGVAQGCMHIGSMYELGNGVAINLGTAAKFYQRACTGGIAMSCKSLGMMYESGNGVAKKPTQALDLYSKACDGGIVAVCYDLGRRYDFGTGGTIDFKQAAVFYRKACDGGVVMSCYSLGLMYEYGNGVAKDRAQALVFYRKSCDGGVKISCFYVKKLTP